MNGRRGAWRGSGDRSRYPRGHKQVCHHFQRGSCKFGQSCRFSHENSGKDIHGLTRHGTFGEPQTQIDYDWKRLLGFESFHSAHKKVWHEILPLLEGENRETQQRIAKDLVSDQSRGLQVVMNTLDIDQHDGSSRLSIAHAFLQVITHSALLDCLSVDTYLGTLYKFIAGTNGVRAITYFTQLCRHLRGAHSATCAPVKRALGAEDILPDMLKALYDLLRREPRMLLNDDLPTLLTEVDAVVEVMSFPHESTARVEAMKQMLRSATSLLVTTSTQPTTLDLRLATSTFPLDIVIPGNRHDNDYTDISEINIFPTLGEIVCDEADYLPSTNFLNPSFLSDPIQRYLDSAFRLLRHDIFGPLKDDLNSMLQGMREGTPHHQLLRNGNMQSYMYSKARIQHLKVHERRGLEACVSFDLPPSVRRKSQGEQRHWWQESPRFSEGGLMCFVTGNESSMQILFLVITDKNTLSTGDKSRSSLVPENNHAPSITAKLASGSEADVHALTRLYSCKSEGFLVDVPSLIPATFVHVLKNLQGAMRTGELPLHRWIVPSNTERRNRRLSATEVVPAPAYAMRHGFVFNLDSITGDGAPELGINPCAPGEVDLYGVEAWTGLDRGQCQGLVAALTREYALIQGPPGTGKSYLGVKLLQVLLAHKAVCSLGPIIVMHAPPLPPKTF